MPVSARRNYLRVAAGTASPREAIKAHCMECVCWDRQAIIECTALACPLWAYRPFKGGPSMTGISTKTVQPGNPQTVLNLDEDSKANPAAATVGLAQTKGNRLNAKKISL